MKGDFMAIPDYQSIMKPLLKLLADRKNHHIRDVVKTLANEFNLTDEELEELLPTGRSPLFYNRVGWARLHLKKASLVEDPDRGYIKITSNGLEALAKKPQQINKQFLRQYPAYQKAQEESRARRKSKALSATVCEEADAATPEEALEASFAELQEGLAAEIIDSILKCSPEFFERLVIDVLVAMGYGGSRKEAGQAIGKSGDEGIDGIIKEDKLGLDIIYIQAKRWQGNIGRPEIQKFAGALLGQQAKKGIFITTSAFSTGAEKDVQNLDSKIILVDGHRLAELMIEYNVGVDPVTTYILKKVDSDYFIYE